MDLSFIQDNSIIICPSEIKNEFITYFNNKIEVRIKCLSKSELIERCYFRYDDNALIYLMKKGKTYSEAKEILVNLRGIKRGNEKLDELYNIYEELNQKHLLKKDYLFKNLFNEKKVYVYGYSKKDEELNYLLKSYLKVDYEFIERNNKNNKPMIINFESKEDEVNRLFIEIAKLVEKGVSLNDIYLYKYPSDYDMLIKKYARYYNLPIEFTCELNLYETRVFNEYLYNLKECNNLIEAYDKLDDYSYYDYGAKRKLVNLINDALNVSDSVDNIYQFIIEKAKGIRLKGKKYDNSIKIVSSNVVRDGYVFIVGFSLGSYPTFSKDTDYLSDKEKKILHLNTSVLKNKINEEELSYFVSNQDNLYISRTSKDGKEEKYDTQVAKSLNLKNIIKNDEGIRYSKELSEIEVARYNDVYFSYRIDGVFVDAIDPKSFAYREYDYHFKYSDVFKDDKMITTSYSRINEYNKCPFKYFIMKLCKCDSFEDSFTINLGNLFHKILEDSLSKSINLNDYQSEIDEKFVTCKDKFFLNHLLPQVEKIIEKNKDFISHSSFNKQYAEVQCAISVDDKSMLKGKIDKIVVNEKEKEIYIVDYKTYNLSFNRMKVPYGFDLQLPLYGVLLKEQFPNYKQVGLYIQNICVQKENEKSFLLNGLTLLDERVISRLDHSIVNKSYYIDKITKTSKGLKKNKSLISEQEFEDILKDAKEALSNSIRNIREGKFDIKPTRFTNEQSSPCSYCKLSSVCFHEARDTNIITIEKEEKESE